MPTIKGKATPKGSLKYSKRFGNFVFRNLGKTDLTVSSVGFGGYRVDVGISDHRDALAIALLNGVNLIDTSSNYSDGGSEEMVGEVLEDLIGENRLKRQSLVVVSKAGYLQGENYLLSQERKASNRPFQELIELNEGLEHCIHPEFLEDQINRSLARLGLETIDVFLLHNPEYFLFDAKQQARDKLRSAAEYYDRLKQAFEYLEKEVEAGRIGHYGISSNTFPVERDDFTFTDFKKTLEIAECISPDHHYSVIQFPLNLLETEAVTLNNQISGISLIQAAKDADMGVLVNRPLNALKEGRLFRLADPQVSSKKGTEVVRKTAQAFDLTADELLQQDIELPKELAQIIHETKETVRLIQNDYSEVSSLEEWHFILQNRLRPAFENLFSRMSPFRDYHEGFQTLYPKWIEQLNAFVESLGEFFHDRKSSRVIDLKSIINEAGNFLESDNLAQMALFFPRNTDGVSSVLVGMRKQSYVEEVLAALPMVEKKGISVETWEKLKQTSHEVLNRPRYESNKRT